MILPIADTPLAEPVRLPSPRAGGADRALAPAFLPSEGRERLLDLLGGPETLVVSTGQQPGLLTGPAYTVTKALSARGLARALERRWGRPVVPVYWVPGDDHDFEEVASAAWLGLEGDVVRAGLAARAPDAPLLPMARQRLDESVLEVLRTFEQTTPAGVARDDVLAVLSRHYAPGRTVAEAFGGVMAEWLGPRGLLCLDGSHPAVKRAAAPVLRQALARAGEIELMLVARAAALEAAGRSPSVPVGDGASLVFLDTPLGRDRLVMAGPGFQTRRGKAPVTPEALDRLLAEHPELLSGNVLLRPVIESAILPTVAYAAGPGELRYLALAEPVYQALGVHRQQPTPRWSGLLLEPRVTRVLDKFGVSVVEFLAEGNLLEARIARRAMPDGTEAAFQALQHTLQEAYGPVIRAAAAVDPTLERPAEAARSRALHAVRELEKKLVQHGRKRESTELGQVARARASARPEGKPQERVLSMAGFLARYGTGLLDELAGHIEAWYDRALEADGTPA